MPADATDPVDALLAEVDLANRHLSFVYLASVTPRLADMVRALRSALEHVERDIPWIQRAPAAAEGNLNMIRDTLDRVRRIAKGE